MKLHELKPAEGSRGRKKRIGRGEGIDRNQPHKLKYSPSCGDHDVVFCNFSQDEVL